MKELERRCNEVEGELGDCDVWMGSEEKQRRATDLFKEINDGKSDELKVEKVVEQFHGRKGKRGWNKGKRKPRK